MIKKTRIENINKINIGNLDINSLPNKFDNRKVLLTGIPGILIVTETKLDNTSPVYQFHSDRYSKPYRLDRYRNGGVRVIYFREGITSRMFTMHSFPGDIEGLFVE